MGTVIFQHNYVGNLRIDTGIDNAEWSYNLNTASFPTYGGEVVQILSVYIDNVTLSGTISTYAQMEAIYSYFATYIQTASQGKTAVPNIGDATNGAAYNLYPVYFSYPERNWTFKLYPVGVPGFRYGREVVAPQWHINAFVVDDSPDLDLIKDGIKALATSQLPSGDTFSLNGEISPNQGNPDTDPFQTYQGNQGQQQKQIQQYSTYYNNLLPAYTKGDFSALTAGLGSNPAPPTSSTSGGAGSQNTGPGVNVPAPQKKKDPAWAKTFRAGFQDEWNALKDSGMHTSIASRDAVDPRAFASGTKAGYEAFHKANPLAPIPPSPPNG